MLALEEILISTCPKSRVITLPFNGKTLRAELPLLCVTKIIDQLNCSESHTGSLLYCDSIMEGYQYSNGHV